MLIKGYSRERDHLCPRQRGPLLRSPYISAGFPPRHVYSVVDSTEEREEVESVWNKGRPGLGKSGVNTTAVKVEV